MSLMSISSLILEYRSLLLVSLIGQGEMSLLLILMPLRLVLNRV